MAFRYASEDVGIARSYLVVMRARAKIVRRSHLKGASARAFYRKSVRQKSVGFNGPFQGH